MTPSLRDRGVGAIVLDIEGTTTPVSFVYDVLFPFARTHLAEFLRDEHHSRDLADVIRWLSAEHAVDEVSGERPPAWPAGDTELTRVSFSAYVGWLMDRDRKSPGLKLLQGLIWERGYQAGVLRGQVFPDVPPALRRWREAGIDVAIYSSGSVLAQRRLFESTEHGDLTALIAGFFDTSVGAKTSADSYRHIAETLRHQPAEMLFVSDVVAELTAARASRLQVLLAIRPGNAPQPGADAFEAIRSFEDV